MEPISEKLACATNVRNALIVERRRNRDERLRKHDERSPPARGRIALARRSSGPYLRRLRLRLGVVVRVLLGVCSVDATGLAAGLPGLARPAPFCWRWRCSRSS